MPERHGTHGRAIYDALRKPRTQGELRELAGMSRSGVLHLLRRMQRDGLVHPVERVCHTMIWERGGDGVALSG